MRKHLNGFLVLIIVSGITVSSLINTGVMFPGVSYTFHFVAYFLLAGALMLYFHESFYGHMESFFLSVFTGLFMELLQIHVAFRTFSWIDVAVNFLGASVVFLDHHLLFVSRLVEIEDSLIEGVFSQ